jgi:hypothetical protein
MEAGDLPTMFQNFTSHASTREEFDTGIDLDYVAQHLPDVHSNFKPFLGKAAILTAIAGNQQLAPTAVNVPSQAFRDRFTTILAGLFAAPILKKAAEMAFLQTGRAMTSPQVLENLGRAFQEMTGEDPRLALEEDEEEQEQEQEKGNGENISNKRNSDPQEK